VAHKGKGFENGKANQEEHMSIQQSGSRLRIAFLTQLDPLDKRSWSCSLYYIGQALQRHCGDVTYMGPLRSPEPSLLSRIRAKSSLVLFKKHYLLWMSLSTARQIGLEATQKLAGQAFDVIVVAASEAAIAFAKTNIPIVLVGDNTFAQVLNYMPRYATLSGQSRREIYAIERQVFKKVRASIMSSEWAACSVLEDYHAAAEHVYTVSFGANLDAVPAREVVAAKKPSGRCRLLFVGIEWQRKGGDIAFETLLKLEEKGIEAELVVCGCVLPSGVAHPRMTVIPYLDKNDARQAREIEQLYARSDFLILPTRADCAPNVFKEANAFGLPVITSDTGGIASIICNGVNGYMLPPAARGGDYADLIAAIYRDEQRYLRLVHASRAAFEERLNWDAWGRRVHDILLKECARAGSAAAATFSESRGVSGR
jgi:glycosyltransferase involved in cell wall biosynthesis